MTPADLAELLKSTAAAVLTEHGLDTAVLPATVTVERPRNPGPLRSMARKRDSKR